MISIRPESAHYFYGSITRENSELILWDRGCIDGMFLLRASQNKDAEFVLSLCYRNNVLHYPIKKSIDGKYFVCGLPTEKFMSPVELVQSVKQLACLPKIPCNRAIDVFMPDGTYGVSEQEIEKAIGERAAEWGIQASELEKLMKEKPEDFRDLIVKSLHTSRPWFHGNISREEAEARIAKSGHSDGKFLVRERDNSSFTLCLSFNQNIKHYKIDVLPSGEVGIQDGQRFGNLILLVHHYSFLSDGLWCALQEPCVRPGMSAAGSSMPPIANLPMPKVSDVEPRPHLRSEPTSPLSPTTNSMPFTNNVDTDASNAPKTSQDPDGGNKPQPPPKPRGIANILKQSSRATPIPVSQNQPKSINLDQNHNNCTQSDEVSMGDGSSPREDGSSQAGKPVPAPRKKPQQKKCSGKSDEIARNNDADEEELPAPGRIGKVLKSLSLENILQGMKPRPASWAPSLVSPTTPIEKLLPAHLPSNSVPTQVVTPLRKTSAPTPMSTNSMSVVISELKLQISGIGLQQQQLPRSPDAAVSPNSGTVQSPKSSCENLASTPEDVGAEQTVKFPVIEEVQLESQETEFEPVYEEIDPDYDNNSTDKRNRTNALSRTSSEIDGSTCDSVISDAVQENPWDDASEDGPNNGTLKLKRRPTMSVEESEHHYKAMKRCRKTPTTIDRSLIIPQEILGCGQFGDVMKATLKSGSAEIPVAVKMLRNSLPSAKREIMREASIMMELDHAHIVRLSGICEGEPFLLVMEMAPLGPLGLYLKKHATLPCRDLLILMHQVALGMEYLESKQFVHRDLAARNVLLVNENFAKISDFGMSRTLGLHSDYYRVEPQGKLPLKWYAPECIYYFRFSSKSDVWSYGVTLWEAFSYGERPYKGLVGREILTMFASGQRLPCPLGCTQVVYDIMWKCWQLQPEERPTFAQLVVDLRKMLN